MAETHESLGLFRVPQVLNFQLVGVTGGQSGLSLQRPRCPVLFGTCVGSNVVLRTVLVPL